MPGVSSSQSSSLTLAYLIVFAASLCLSLLLVPLFRALAIRFNIVDEPGARKIHLQPKPYLGGVAIYLAFTVVVLGGAGLLLLLANSALFQDLPAWFTHQAGGVSASLPVLSAILLGATITFLIGLWDDVTRSPNTFYVKVVVQITAALIAVASGVTIDFFATPYINIPISLLWIVGITNAFNLLDNMDGLASGVASIALLIFAAIAVMLGQYYVALINFALLGSILGFLRYNFFPSKIFMGDAGSLFIGYLLGTLTVLEAYVDGSGVTVFSAVMPLLILSVPLADTASVIIIRTRNRKPIYVGDRNHLSHRLVSMGLSQKSAVVLLYGVSLVMGLSALLLPALSLLQGGVLVLQSLLVVVVLSTLIFYGNRGRQPSEELKHRIVQTTTEQSSRKFASTSSVARLESQHVSSS